MLKLSYVIFLVLLVGCATHSPAPPPPPAPPYLLHLPGIGGARNLDRRMVRGLVEGGYTGQTEIYDWTAHDPGLPALLSYERNQQQAQIVADKLTAVRRADPRRTIIVTAHSGGTGIAVWALGKLPPDVKVDRVILIASALSPGYDLSPALGHVYGLMFNFWSSLDSTVLAVGTTLFGTIDGVKAPAAGFLGFIPPPNADPIRYKKLRQFHYESGWMQWGDTGGHIGGMSQAFARHVLASLVTGAVSPTTLPAVTPLELQGAAIVPAPLRPTTATTQGTR